MPFFKSFFFLFVIPKSSRPRPLLILYTLTSVCIFSIVFSIHFPGADKGNLRASLVGNHFIYTRDLNVLFRSDILRKEG